MAVVAIKVARRASPAKIGISFKAKDLVFFITITNIVA